jgi:peptide/nickel transport system substrate-binding protein
VALFIKMNDMVCSDHYVIPLAHRPSVVAMGTKLSAPPSGTSLLMDTLAHWYKED